MEAGARRAARAGGRRGRGGASTLAAALTGKREAQHQAAELIPWLVPAAAAQVYAGVAASALAALDDYGTAAFGYAAGAVAGLVVIVALVGHGVTPFGWGLAVNGAVALGIPLAFLVARGGLGRPDAAVLRRLRELAEGVALPFALQGLYVIGYRFASGLGTGQADDLLLRLPDRRAARRGDGDVDRARLVGAARARRADPRAGRPATSSPRRGSRSPSSARPRVCSRSRVSGSRAGRSARTTAAAPGAELGRLVVYFAPWMVASVAVSVAFPLLFVRGRARWLPLLAVAALCVHVLVEWGGRAAFGLAGIAAGMAVTTGAILVVLLWPLGALTQALRGLLDAAVVCGGLAAVCFGLPRVVLGAVPAAAVGLALYAAALGVWRPAGLRSAWIYVRTLQ